MHDAAHGLLLRNKPWNDRIGQWLTAYPAMADVLLYRRVHFQHHRHAWTELDPDLGLASALPVTRSSFRRKLLRDLSGQTAYARQRMLVRFAAGLNPRGRGPLNDGSPVSVTSADVDSRNSVPFVSAVLVTYS